MMTALRSHGWLTAPALAGIALTLGGAPVLARQPSAGLEKSAQGRAALRVARELEAGRIEEARIDAEALIKQFPGDFLLRRRRAQVRVCQAAEWDSDLHHAVQDAAFT